MAYKVKCTLVAFAGDVESFPCHFGYEIGDEFIFDGEKFIGRVCPGLFESNMLAVLDNIRYSGMLHYEYLPWYYSGNSKKDSNMKKYDGIGWSNLKEPPKGAEKYIYMSSLPIPTKRIHVAGFHCGDLRTIAVFNAEPFGLSDKGFDLPFYSREMNLLEKIKAKPGLNCKEILDLFSKFEREEIYPPLSPVIVEIMLEELNGVGYVELRDGKVYPKTSP